MSIKNSLTHLRTWQRFMAILLVFVMIFMSQVSSVFNVQAGASQAPQKDITNIMLLNVESATDGTPINQFKYIINIDNTGTTDQRTPAEGCNPRRKAVIRIILAIPVPVTGSRLPVGPTTAPS